MEIEVGDLMAWDYGKDHLRFFAVLRLETFQDTNTSNKKPPRSLTRVTVIDESGCVESWPLGVIRDRCFLVQAPSSESKMGTGGEE